MLITLIIHRPSPVVFGLSSKRRPKTRLAAKKHVDSCIAPPSSTSIDALLAKERRVRAEAAAEAERQRKADAAKAAAAQEAERQRKADAAKAAQEAERQRKADAAEPPKEEELGVVFKKSCCYGING